MSTFKVMVKAKGNKRYQCHGIYTDSRYAEREATRYQNELWTLAVKIIVDDGNFKEELIYK